ncbi:MAG: hypothetical protein ABIR98_10760, partial [Usitatibacter sp.]
MAAAPKDLSKEAREKLAAEPIEISAGELSALAKQRAEKVTGYLVTNSHLPAERLITASAVPEALARSSSKLSRVDFALR